MFTVTPDNVTIRQLEHQIGIQKGVLVETIRALRDKVTTRKNEAKTKLREIESVYYGLPTKELEYARLERVFAINEKYYTMLLEKRIAYQISKEGFVSNNQILEDVLLPTTPVSPKGKMIVLSFLMAGLLFGFAFISIRYLVHNEITSLNEIVRLSNASISTLGVIPKYREPIPQSMLLVDKNPKSMIAEAFRTVRTNMQFIDNSEGPKVVGVTSAISGEGKTFVVLNLAGIIAFSGKRVVLLDLDMRRPRIHKGMGVDNNIGMSTLLIGKSTIEESVRKSSLENLHFITAGPIPPNPSELILSKAFSEILNQLKEQYDVIVIDTPPVGLVTDGISIIAQADYPIYVFRADYSKKRFVQNVDRLTNENRISRLSVILNSVDIERNKYAYSYGYGYGYSYEGSGYYDEGTKKKGFFSRLFKK
jgi:tyrosine-protein kinase Etk/Wzc